MYLIMSLYSSSYTVKPDGKDLRRMSGIRLCELNEDSSFFGLYTLRTLRMVPTNTKVFLRGL